MVFKVVLEDDRGMFLVVVVQNPHGGKESMPVSVGQTAVFHNDGS